MHLPTFWIGNDRDSESYSYSPTSGNYDPYDSIADLTSADEFISLPGLFQMDTMAMAVGDTVSPDDGLEVRAHCRATATGIDSDYGVDVDQSVTTWVTRYFTVPEEGTYVLRSQLAGDAVFDYFEAGPRYRAAASISGLVTIHELVLDDLGVIVSGPDEVISLPVTIDDRRLWCDKRSGNGKPHALSHQRRR